MKRADDLRAGALCRVCHEPWSTHPKPDHAWDTPPIGDTRVVDNAEPEP